LEKELPGGIQPWDWRHVTEKVRKAKCDFDETLLRPYLSNDSAPAAMFAVSGNLIGLDFKATNIHRAGSQRTF
jgi:peptidyl-dipeptidase Dcp